MSLFSIVLNCSQLFLIIPLRIMRIIGNNEDKYSNVSLSVSTTLSSSSNIPVAMLLRGWIPPYCWDLHILYLELIGVFDVSCTAVWSSALKVSSAAFAFEGHRLLSSSRLNTLTFWSSHACKVTGRLIKWALEVCAQKPKNQKSQKVPKNWQVQTTQKSTLHCSYLQESTKLEVLDNFDYGMALYDKLGVYLCLAKNNSQLFISAPIMAGGFVGICLPLAWRAVPWIT